MSASKNRGEMPYNNAIQPTRFPLRLRSKWAADGGRFVERERRRNVG